VRLSIIIPVYNEEKLVTEVLQQLEALHWPEFVKSHEIVLVDDSSDDQTHEVLRQWTADKASYKLLQHSKNKGKGAAVRTGIAAATGDTILIQDADLELSPADIPLLLNAMQTPGVEMVNGSRYLPGPIRPLSSYKRYIANKLFSWLTSLLIDIRITDMACGYKLIRKSLLQKIHLQEDRFAIEAELLIKAARIKRNHIVEVPVQYFPRNQGEGKKFKPPTASVSSTKYSGFRWAGR
jgi:glycosyltransferase involved in cell wall biosynthesis